MAKPRTKRSWKVRMGVLVVVDNKERKFGSAPEYLLVKLQFPKGAEKLLLFTDAAIACALERAERNPEDLMDAPIIRDWID